MELSIEKIIASSGGTFFGDEKLKERKVTSFVIDSRLAKEGCAYVAIQGEKVDGHSFIKDTFSKGACLCIGEKDFEPEEEEAYIKADSSPEALGRIASAYMKSLDIPVVGVTGSVGKTGTKEMVASVLASSMNVAKTKGNHNNEIGLPLTCLETPEDAQISVLEMGISAENEMDYLTGIIQPAAAVVTNIGVSHMEILGSQRGIFDEKIKIAKNLPETGLLVINGDDEFLSGISDDEIDTKAPVIRYGFSRENDIYADDIVIKGLEGAGFTIRGLKEAPDGLEVKLSVPGRHMILNSLAAAAIGEHFGVTPENITKGLLRAGTIAGRMNIIKTGDYTVIDDSYNASPVSMKAAIETLSEAEGRKICVLGNMYELGDDSRKMHYGVGRFAAEKGVSVLFVCGDLAEDIARGALGVSLNADIKKSAEDEYVEIMMTGPDQDVIPEFYIYDDNADMAEKIKEVLRPGDTVLVKASNSMRFADVVKSLTGQS